MQINLAFKIVLCNACKYLAFYFLSLKTYKEIVFHEIIPQACIVNTCLHIQMSVQEQGFLYTIQWYYRSI